jgi:ABC-type uncharacterized transport system permease subunit
MPCAVFEACGLRRHRGGDVRTQYTGEMILGVALHVASIAASEGALASSPDQLRIGVLVCGLLAMALYAHAAWAASGKGAALSWRTMVLAWVLHGASLAMEIVEPGRGARFGFAPALSVTLWLVVAAHALEKLSHSLLGARRVVCVLALVAIALALVWPGDARLADSPWAPLHWLLGLVSYGLVGAAVVHARMLDGAERKLREPKAAGHAAAAREASPGLPLMTLERLTFRFVDAGFVVLTLALVMGTWFALSRAGWRWDHKTVFSLSGWIVMALLVTGRHVRGWRGRRATRWIYAGAFLLLMAYVGSRFVFEVLLGRAY